MNLKILVFTLFICIGASCQERLNALVTVDDIITGSYNLSDAYLIVKNDTISLKYEMGRFELTDKEILKTVDGHTKVSLNFRYYATCPEPKSYYYNINLESRLLLQEYLLLKIYNFDKYPNVFVRNTGYGFEYTSPVISEGLPKRKKIKRNSCLN